MPGTTSYKVTSTEREVKITQTPMPTSTPVTRRNWVLRDSKTSSLRPIERAPETTLKGRAYIIDIPYGQTKEAEENNTALPSHYSDSKIGIANDRNNVDTINSSGGDLPEPPNEIVLSEFRNSLQRHASIASSSTPAPPSFPKSPNSATSKAPTSTQNTSSKQSSFGQEARKVLGDSFRFILQEENEAACNNGHRVGRKIEKWEQRRSSEETPEPSGLRRSPGQAELATLGIDFRESSSPSSTVVGGRLTPRGAHLNTAYTCEVCENIRRVTPAGQCRLCAAFDQEAFDESSSQATSVRQTNDYHRPYVVFDRQNGPLMRVVSPPDTLRSNVSSPKCSIVVNEQAVDVAPADVVDDDRLRPPPPSSLPSDPGGRPAANPSANPLVTLSAPDGPPNAGYPNHNNSSTSRRHGARSSRSARSRRERKLSHNRKFCLSVTFVVVLAMVIGVGIGLTIWFD